MLTRWWPPDLKVTILIPILYEEVKKEEQTARGHSSAVCGGQGWLRVRCSVSGLLSEQFIAVMEPRSQSQTLNIISRCLDAVFVAVSF